MDASFCLAALKEALAKVRQAGVFFSNDTGSQFTSAAFPGAPATAGVATYVDGRGRWMGNVFIERFWR